VRGRTQSWWRLSPGHTALVPLGPNMCSTTLLHGYGMQCSVAATSLDYACVSDEMLEQQVPLVRAGLSRFGALVHIGVRCELL